MSNTFRPKIAKSIQLLLAASLAIVTSIKASGNIRLSLNAHQLDYKPLEERTEAVKATMVDVHSTYG